MRHTCWFLLILCGVSLLTARANAEIRESSDEIVSEKMERIVNLLPGLPFSIPPQLTSDSKVYVLIIAGGAFYDIRLLGRPSASPQHLATALENALRQAGVSADSVEWSQDDNYAAARFRYSRARFGENELSVTIPISALAKGLQTSGLTPYGAVRVPHYVQLNRASHLPASLRFQGENFIWYAFQTASEPLAINEPFSLNLETSASGPVYALALFLTFGTGIAGFLSLLGIFFVARSPSLPFEKKRRITSRLVYVPTGAVCILSALIGFFWMSSPWAAIIADLWLGSWMRASTVSFMLPTVMAMMLFAIAGFFLQARLLPEPRSEEEQEIAVVTQPERALRKRIALYSLLPVGLAVALICTNPFPRKNGFYQLWMMGCMVMSFAGPHLIGWSFRRELQSVEEEMSDQRLSEQMERIGREVGYTVRLVRLGVSEAAQKHIGVETKRNGKVIVWRKSLEVLTPEELDFVVAYTITSQRHLMRGLWRSTLWIFPYSLLLTALGFGYIPLPPITRLILAFMLFVGIVPVTWLFARHQKKKEGYPQMYEAIRATMNPAAALSALEKTKECAGTGDDSTENERVHSRTIATLRRAASELGLTMPAS